VRDVEQPRRYGSILFGGDPRPRSSSKLHFEQGTPPADNKLNGKPLASGQKVILGAGGKLMGGDQITCGVQDAVVACIVIGGFSENHGDDTARRHGFALAPQRSWAF
jgi:hypothetical protein